VLSSISDSFLYSVNYIGCFANANTDLSFLIADDHDRTEAELFTTFDNLGYAADLDDTFLPFRFFFSTSAIAFLTIALAFAFFIAVAVATVAAATVATST
jgi:hypothetical protein